MAETLTDLETRLQGKVAARNGVPSDYEQLVKDAVVDLSQRMPLRRRSSLSIVNGTATYTLPTDLQELLWFEELRMQAGASGTIITSDGTLIPAADEWAESWEVVGGQITFYPTPTFNQTRYFWYAAGHVPSGDSYSYPLMTAAMATVVLLKAQALALLEQANEAAKEAWSYETGDQAVNKQRLAEALQRQARLLDEQYVRALEGLRGPVSVLG